MSESIRVLLIGATGLVGRTIIGKSPDHSWMTLQGLARREIDFPAGVRMELVLAPGKQWAEIIPQLAPDSIISALGTTRKGAGSSDAFREVDHDLVLQIASAAKNTGVMNFAQISSVGADPYSKNTYLQVKGETEKDLKKLKFRRLDLLRPGLLRGKRRNDLRPLEKAGQIMAPAADFFLRGDRSKYRSIRATDLADAALAVASAKAGGQFVHEHESLMRLARDFQRKHVEAEGTDK